jgi:hypothetical protein
MSVLKEWAEVWRLKLRSRMARSSIGELASAINVTAHRSARVLVETCCEELDNNGQFSSYWEIWIEFAAFFDILADRKAFVIFGPQGRGKLMDELAIFILEPTVDTFLSMSKAAPGSVASSRSGAMEFFCERLGLASREYGLSMEEFAAPNKEFSSDAMASKLGRKIAEICGSGGLPAQGRGTADCNPAIAFQGIMAAHNGFMSKDWRKLVRQAGVDLGLREQVAENGQQTSAGTVEIRSRHGRRSPKRRK